MPNEGWLGRTLRAKLRGAGRTAARARAAYASGKVEGRDSFPRDEAGRARIVCRRHAEERAVALDDGGRPDCFDAAHADCRGCVEDVRAGRVETW